MFLWWAEGTHFSFIVFFFSSLKALGVGRGGILSVETTYLHCLCVCWHGSAANVRTGFGNPPRPRVNVWRPQLSSRLCWSGGMNRLFSGEDGQEEATTLGSASGNVVLEPGCTGDKLRCLSKVGGGWRALHSAPQPHLSESQRGDK